jgi:hypothetical protein
MLARTVYVFRVLFSVSGNNSGHAINAANGPEAEQTIVPANGCVSSALID